MSNIFEKRSKKFIPVNFLVILFIPLIIVKPTFPDDTVRILMLESPREPLPAEQAEKVERLTGKVFFKGQSYSGSFDIMKDENGLYVINNLPFEKYIEGVVASEVGKDWEIEALKAQAVIARTYAIFNKNLNTENMFHLTSSVLHQVYKGDNTDPFITQAVEGTKGEILTYEGNPINALYHATCEGKTELPEEVWVESYPYMKSVECNGVNAPYESWQKKFTFEQISKALGINGIKDIYIASYTSTGRSKTLKIVTETSEIEIKATDLRKLLGYRELPSTHFSITKNDTEIIFNGKGYGHGVGLSQWGALEMARKGKTYKEILAHFYPGTAIMKYNGEIHSRNLSP
ncbi:MAG: SpoIID/LytB domain-containing protein [Nitrospirae bacterium]|nr:SpoIID/LytB domain-containing protein [Nitrospirota bacterium]